MAYINNIPASTDLISTSQGQIKDNFTAIDSGTSGDVAARGFSRNHYTMTDSTNGGLHYRVDYPAAVSSPTVATTASSIYPKTVTNVELYFKNATQDMQISNSLLTAASGQGMLPGGLQIRTGTGTTGSANNVTFTPNFLTGVIALVATPISTPGQVNVTALSTSQATVVQGGGGSLNFYWIAIGY